MRQNPLLVAPIEPEEVDYADSEWMKGSKITARDLKYGSPQVERVTSTEWMASATGRGGKGVASKPAANPNVISFGGKYQGRLIVDIIEEDPRYIDWACRTIPGFEAKVEAVS